MTTEPLPPAAEAAHLTEALRRAGVLGAGAVGAVTIESSRPTILSRIIRLRLTYEGAAPEAPATLILKTKRPDLAEGLAQGGQHEVAFYERVAAATPPGVVVRCFDSGWNAESKDWHLLLEDLTDSHVIATTWPLPPTMDQCAMIVRARARCHAAWWDHPELGISVGQWQHTGAMDQQRDDLAARIARFADDLGDRLSRDHRDLFERLLASFPRLMARYHTHRDMTIVHGDAHVWNCFLPRDGGRDGGRLFDWDSWRVDTASDDLAYMMAMHWYPDLRRGFEQPLLDLYHATLVDHGVRGYDRAKLGDDYRLSVLWAITTPVWQAALNIPPVIWWNNFERIMLAVDDLGCRDLLG